MAGGPPEPIHEPQPTKSSLFFPSRYCPPTYSSMHHARAPGAKTQALPLGACRPDQDAHPRDSKQKQRGPCGSSQEGGAHFQSEEAALGSQQAHRLWSRPVSSFIQWRSMTASPGWRRIVSMVFSAERGSGKRAIGPAGNGKLNNGPPKLPIS